MTTEFSEVTEQFLQVAELLPEPMLLVSADGAIVAANSAAKTQFEPSHQEIRGKNLAVLCENPNFIASWLQACSRVKNFLPGALVLNLPSGGKLSYRAEGAVFRASAAGNPAIILLRLTPKEAAVRQFRALNQKIEELYQEIHRREQAQRLLEESEERFRQLAEHITAVFWVSDPGMGRVLYVSPAYEEIWGKSVQSLYEQPRSFMEAIHEEDRAQVLETLRRQALGEATVIEYRVVRPDGSVAWIIDRGFPIRSGNGKVYRACGVAEDFTTRKLAEIALQEHNERLQLLGLAAGHLLTARDANELFQGLFGHIKRHVDVDASFNYRAGSSDHSLGLQSCTGALQQAARLFPRLEFNQGVSGLAAAHGKPIAEAGIQDSGAPAVQLAKGLGVRAYICFPLVVDGRLLGTFSFTSRTQERFTREDLEFFQTMVDYATLAYERLSLLTSLKEANARKDEFLATLGHELRNPLAAIAGAVALQEAEAGAIEETPFTVQVLGRQVRHLARIVDDLLDVSRITRGQLDLRRERITLTTAVEHALDAIRPAAAERNQKLRVSLPEQPVWVKGDLTRLAQVVTNLLNNAVKYTPVGGHIWVSLELDGGEATLQVRDNGRGIPSEFLPQVFDLFSRGDRTPGMETGGLGVGLTLVRRLVEMHGGTVNAQSEGPGRGSAFTIRLPCL